MPRRLKLNNNYYMSRHIWKHKGILFNFCIKCGMKKSWSNEHDCQMSNFNADKHYAHNVIIDYKNAYSGNMYKCKKCGIKSNKCDIKSRYSQWNLIFSNQPGSPAYVPYKIIEKIGKDGIINRYAKHTRHFERINGRRIGLYDVAYWPIYCGLSEDEFIIMDIIS